MSAVLAPPPRPIVNEAFFENPYPAYRALQEAGPLHWSEEFFGGAWLLTRHADVAALLRDARFSAQRTGGWVMQDTQARAELKPFQQLFARAMLFLDAPDHQRIRQVMSLAFRPAALQRLLPHIEQIADELLQAVDASAGFDFMSAVARVLPARVIALMLGFEGAPDPAFIDCCDDLADFIGAARPSREQVRRAQASLLALVRSFEPLLAHKRRVPGDDLVSRLLQAETEGLIQAGPELLAQCAMLLFAGHETTRNLLGNGLHALLTHPAQWAMLRSAPALLPGAVRELLRFDSPVQYTGRRVAADTVLHGRLLRRGELVLALIGAANRDPAFYAQPDAFDITREQPAPLSFGSGAHACIGSALSSIEAQVVFSRLLRRWPRLHLTGERAGVWNRNPVYRGLAQLPVGDAAG
jgi:cytochrome P450